VFVVGRGECETRERGGVESEMERGGRCSDLRGR
jgi:hypothetical protein